MKKAVPPLLLPSVTVERGKQGPCAICGGLPNNGHEVINPDGKISMSIERDLCLECACWLWRALKYQNSNIRDTVITLLAEYPPTAAAVNDFTRALDTTGNPNVQ